MLFIALKGAGWALLIAAAIAFTGGAIFGVPGMFAHSRGAEPGWEGGFAAVAYFGLSIMSGIPLIVAGIGAGIAVYRARGKPRG
jgi:hypothetical protein